MRFITIILLLAVCFFGGVTYGTVDKKNLHEEIDVGVNHVTTTPKVVEQERLEEQDYLVNKTASLFEKIVSSLYEGVINLMYKIANLFFD